MFDWAVDAQNTVFVCANTMALFIALLSYVRIFQIVRYHRKQICIQLSEVSFRHRDEENSLCTSFCRKDSTSKQWEEAMSEEMDGNESAVTGSEAGQIGVTKPENHEIKTLGVAKASFNHDRVLSSSKRELKGTEAFERGQETSNGLANSNLKFSKNTGSEQNQDNVVGLKEVHTESLASKNWIIKSWHQNQKCASADCTIETFKEDTQNEDGSSDGRDQEGIEETYKRPFEEKAGLKENQNPICSFEDNAVRSEREETDQEQRNLTEVMQENSVSHRKDTKNITSNHSQKITTSNRHAQSASSANNPTIGDNQIAIRGSKRFKMRHFKKSVFNMFVIWFLMLVCYLPLICTSALFTLLGRSYSMHLAFNFTTSVMFLNSSMNPVVFCWRIREFRAAVRKTLRELFGFWANQISRIENFSSTINYATLSSYDPHRSSSSIAASGSTAVVSAVLPSKTASPVESTLSSEVMPAAGSSIAPTPTEAATASETSTIVVTETPTSSTKEPTTTAKPGTKPSDKFKEVANVTITEENSLDVVELLENLTMEEEMNSGDTKVTIEILIKIVENENFLPQNKTKRQQLGQSILNVASSLLSEEKKETWGEPTGGRNQSITVTSPMQVLEVIDNIGLKIGEQLGDNESYVIDSPNIAMGVDTKLPEESDTGIEYPRYNELSDAGYDWTGKDHVFIHKEIFDEMAKDNSTKTVVVYTIYSKVSELFPVNDSLDNVFVNSLILGVQFNKQLRGPFKTPIKLRFNKIKPQNTTKPSCSFVDFTKNVGTWSDRGCSVVKDKKKTVECACNHLTNFAILMQVKTFEISKEHYKALTVITYVGCGISLFGLALTLATFLSLETLASERTSIHKNLVVAIGLAQIIFLAGIDATYNPIACKAVALFLHYLYTAAFTWMLCEGIHLYSKIVEVFSEGSKMKYYYALGWGLPLTIVFISACSRWSGYGNERACWISIRGGLIWAFVAPVLIIMTINFVVMIMVIKVIIASVTSLQNPGNTSQVRAGVKGMIVLLPLLGLTWVFGIMAINKNTIAFQYLFAILNSLQGLFIFAFHCIGNTEVRHAYKRLHEKRTLAKSLPEHSLSTSHHSREKRRMDSHETHLTGDDEIIVTKTIRSVSDVKITGENMAMQTFGDTDSGRWSLNCPSPEPFRDLDHVKRA
ncbi:unnamed protein product [Porites evermanni]|uniref:Uncharacterized protein n=1 Tax=Porites evermanni TaxID=104178 RepID=A0ABN8MMH7_9CNID|nr:unnamed protein product [Porites evermanni]